ncbi:class I SAM-dependent methyltransferase [Sporosarcina sp. ANT_H38]|uniref:class I SAM-dependent methyltransferase n=1 Tax=Sporosarcina sp. ANT_H38 TaxID=2597358 RepID=UPI0011F15DD4|nr:class I SAM-dependent methyltransferase [Sporosarcina sp. ANT_H38]KAA0966780.1 class I SAM-dependent methyltransferase [Sporosarcina sp. ANT_H38]
MSEDCNLHKGNSVYKGEDFSIIECEICLFKHIIPLPEQNELDQLYKADYYEKVKPEYIKNVKEDAEWLANVYKERVKVIDSYFEIGETLTALDIGSGPGYFLTAGQELGWDTVGIEPSGQAYSYSKSLGLNVINDFFGSKQAKDLPNFDIIHMNHVLEHMQSPVEMIQLIAQKLKKNGILCVAVPNDFNAFQEVLYDKCDFEPWWISPTLHLNYFTFDSLKQLLEGNGFDVKKRTTSFPMELFLLMGDNYIDDNKMGRHCHEKRKNFEMRLFENNLEEVKEKFYESLAINELGRDVILFARKR